MLRRLAGIALVSAAALATTIAVPATPAHADPWVYGGDSYIEPDPNDPGGKDAGSWMFSGIGSYSVGFQAYDEKLTVHDNLSDGARAHAQVKIYTSGGSYVESDDFYVKTKKTFDLGTPDRSKNIPEGYRVKIRVCTESHYVCSEWHTGIA